MKRAKLLHAISIAVLILLTAVISAVVVHVGRTVPLPVPQATTAAPTEAQSTEPQTEDATEWLPEIEYDTYTPSEIARESFRSTVILGNSQAQALSNFGLIRDADFVTRVGLSINQVLSSKDGDPPIAGLYGHQYEKAVFIFGENELGWPYPENFIAHYKKVIAKVRELNPGVKVYCQAVFPVTAEHSAKNEYGITNENVRLFNGLIEKMCDEIDATFMPVSDAFFDRDGVLPADAATDGVHFGYDYCKIWAGDLSAYLKDGTDETSETAGSAEEESSTQNDEQDIQEGETQA